MTPARASRAYPISAIVGGAGIAAAAIAAAALLAFAAVNWPSADDFCNTVLVRNGGISGAMRWLYTQWSGRVVTGIVLYSTFALVDIPSLHVVSIALTALLLLCAWRIAAFATPSGAPVRPALIGFVVAVFTLGLYPILGQTVFWPTGGIVYLIPLVLLLHWLAGMRHLLKDASPVAPNAYWFAISVALGNSIELVVPVALTYAVVLAVPRWKSMPPDVRRALFLRIAGVAVGAIVLVTAPGNFLRGEATPGSFDLSPALLVREYARLTLAALDTGKVMVAMAVALAVFGAFLERLDRDRPRPRANRRDEAIALVLGGFASLLPVLAAPAQFSPRNALYLLICVLMAGLLMFVQEPDDRRRHVSIGAASLSIVGLIAALTAAQRFLVDHELASLRRDQQLARDAFLRDPAHHGQDVVVKPIRPYPPPTLHAIDITEDNAQIVNQCVARYYDLRSVELAHAAPAPAP